MELAYLNNTDNDFKWWLIVTSDHLDLPPVAGDFPVSPQKKLGLVRAYCAFGVCKYIYSPQIAPIYTCFGAHPTRHWSGGTWHQESCILTVIWSIKLSPVSRCYRGWVIRASQVLQPHPHPLPLLFTRTSQLGDTKPFTETEIQIRTSLLLPTAQGSSEPGRGALMYMISDTKHQVQTYQRPFVWKRKRYNLFVYRMFANVFTSPTVLVECCNIFLDLFSVTPSPMRFVLLHGLSFYIIYRSSISNFLQE